MATSPIISHGGAPIVHIASHGGQSVTNVLFLSRTGLGYARISIDGPDAHLFDVSDRVFGEPVLRFKSAPDRAAPKDANGDGIYEVRAGSHDQLGVFQTFYVHAADFLPPIPSGITVLGSDGNDVITPDDSSVAGPRPGAGEDLLMGGKGADILSAGAGADMILGGAGKDMMTGGEGADVFRFAPGDSKAGGGVRDIITDFEVGVDKLDLTRLDIADYDAQVSYKTVGSGLIVYVDLDMDGFGWDDFAVQLNGVHQPFLDRQDDFLY